MLNWLDNYYKREDGKFIRIIQDADYSEKYLSDLYQGRKTISIALLVVAVFMILLTIVFSLHAGIFFGLGLLLFLYMAIDVQIKMILLVNYIKSTLNLNNGTNLEQNENH